MKQIILIILITFSFLNCKAQSPILAIETDSRIGIQDNSYYKDVNNVLNTFEGTWLYTDGNTSLKIKLVKSTMFFNGDYYEDIMVGGYQYIKNGVEKINTLSDVDNLSIGYDASIWGSSIHNNCFYLPVDDCVDGEKRLDLSLEDVITENHFADLILHKRIINGNEAINAKIVFGYRGQDYPNVLTPEPTLPWQGEYLLIKQ